MTWLEFKEKIDSELRACGRDDIVIDTIEFGFEPVERLHIEISRFDSVDHELTLKVY